MLPFDQGETLADEEVERRLRFAVVDCVDPGSIDQADLHAFSQGPVAAEVAQRAREHLERCEYCRALSSEYRRLAGERRKRRLRQLATGGSIAAAAAVAAVVLLLQPRNAILRTYEPAELRGTMAQTMSAPNADEAPMPKEPWHFAPTSPIELTLRPREEHAAGAVPEVGVYTTAQGGPLVRAQVEARRSSDPGYPVFSINAKGAELFGEVGVHQLVIVLAPDAGALEAIAGKSYEDAKNSLLNAQFMHFVAIYEK